MFLTITYSQPPARDLGYLLHKHPERVQSISLAFGRAYVFFPAVSDERFSVELEGTHRLRDRSASNVASNNSVNAGRSGAAPGSPQARSSP